VPVRVSCPHCRAPCLVAEQHLGVPVQCGRCSRSFTTRADAASAGPALVRLEVGASTAPYRTGPRNEDHFLVRQLSWCNLDERHELVVVAITKDRSSAAAALAPLLNNLLNGTVQDVDIPDAIVAAQSEAKAVVVICDSQVHVGQVAAYRVYHQRGDRLAQVTPPLKLAGGDWLLVIGGGSQPDAAMIQAEIARSSSSAVQLAQQLAERSDGPVVALRCF
jgi:hypothetical protein